MPENPPAPWEYCLYIPDDLRAVTVRRRTLRLILAALRVGRSAGVLRLGAWDADPEPPEPPGSLEELGDAEDGRGLALVRACADQWGRQPLSRNGRRGKLVWCELAAA
ncbi:ATP-binding protein [Streptomyces prunicolor]